MLDLKIRNFRNIESIDLEDTNNVSLVVGYNEAGKSSMIGAIQWAVTGEAYGAKGGATDTLLRYGTDRMSVRVSWGDSEYTRTRTGGDTLKDIAAKHGVSKDVLPLLYHQKLCGDGGNKNIKAFLSTGLTMFNPLAAFANAPDMTAVITQAMLGGNSTTKQLISYFEKKRALCTDPPAPATPSVKNPTNGQLEASEKTRKDAEEVARAKNAALVELETLESDLTVVAAYRKAKAAYDAAASAADPIAATRQALSAVTSIRVAPIRAMADILNTAGFVSPGIVQAVLEIEAAIESANKTLQSNPLPATVVPPKPLSAALMEVADKVPETATAVVMANLSSQLASARAAVKDAGIISSTATQDHEALVKARGAWESYQTALPKYEDALKAARADWDRWDGVVKKIQAAEAEFQKTAADSFTERLSVISKDLLQGRKLEFKDDTLLLEGRPLDIVASESTKWRAEICVMAAIALTCKAPVFIIDGADILDDKNRMTFLTFVVRDIAPHFRHVLVTATVRGKLEDERPAPAGISKFTLNNGIIAKL